MIEIRNLQFDYLKNGNAITAEFAMRIPELSIAPAEQVAVVGASGSGKSTLLNLIAGILSVDEGHIQIDDVLVSELDDQARRAFRLQHIGLVFQRFELLDYLSVADNILLPHYLGASGSLQTKPEWLERVSKLARHMGIENKLSRKIDRLSQGERQRVAICRALLLEPSLILADEPTGNLDASNSDKVLDLLLDYADRNQATLITVTHDQRLLPRFSRVIDIGDLGSAQ